MNTSALKASAYISVDPDTTRLPSASSKDIEAMADGGRNILGTALKAAMEPESHKVLRRWNLKEVSSMLGISDKTIVRGISENKLPGGQRTARQRLFTLEEIHMIQDVLGIRPCRAPSDPPTIVAVSNFKGGVSKTSTAIHLGQYLALKGYRVLMIDTDAQGSLTTMFGLRPDTDVEREHTIAPWLSGEWYAGGPNGELIKCPDWTGTLTTAIRKTHWHGLDLIPANLYLYGAEFELANRQKNDPSFRFYRVLSEGIDTVSDKYDVIILDTPPSLSFLTTNAIFAANGIVMPVPSGIMDFASSVSFFQLLAELLNTISSTEETPKVFDFLGLLISKYEPNNPNHVAIHDWLRAAFSKRVLVNTMNLTTILKIGADIRTAYEIDKYDGNQRTLNRALDYLNNVNGELESAIRAQWPSKNGNKAANRTREHLS